MRCMSCSPSVIHIVNVHSVNACIESVFGFQFMLDALYMNLLEPCVSAQSDIT